MGNEAGKWIMYGVNWNDSECIHNVNEAKRYINEIGFLPLFKNDIPGFSLEERTVPDFWWSGDIERDPWEWRQIIARSGDIAYGKFFNRKAGFISLKLLPYFTNARRDGYDFDSLYEDGKASRKLKYIMDLFMGENKENELFSYEVKEKACFGKGGEKNFEGTLTNLEMMLYLCVRDFGRKKNKKGEEYGWAVSKYSTPEHIWGYDIVTSKYSENPIDSAEKIIKHMKDVYPVATDEQAKKIIGIK